MPEFSVSTLALGKLFLAFAVILLLLRLRVALWKTLFSGCVLLALASSLPLSLWPSLPLACLRQTSFLCMQAMLFGIMLLSALQEAGGQSRRLVDGLERYIRHPRVRLMLFPAIVGLLPMPGGALFSCPMLDAAARGMNLDSRRKTLINYWFRHIWEVAWPLYPGYILASSLLGVSLLTLATYSFPLVFFSLATGWFFFLRDIKVRPEEAAPPEDGLPPGEGTIPPSLGRVLLEALPLAVTLAGAGVFALLLEACAWDAPPQAAFLLSLSLAIAVALAQNRKHLAVPLRQLVLKAQTFRLLLLVYAIFVFKDTLIACGLIRDISSLGGSTPVILLLFVVLPLICGILTGVMVGFVGACFPILLGVASQAGLQEYLLPLVIVAMICGHAGQLLTPLHVCLVVSCEYFRTAFVDVWRRILGPVAVQISYGILWAGVLHAFRLHL
ncbi:MAG: DUF401 family protein [Desulfovibrio sp.]|jgi:integral membrane protein (TIGR00529 family)|nr:DUF401 family protein [Desulfovibrio sp.]